MPEPHLAGLAACLLLHRRRPLRLSRSVAIRWGGAALLAGGTALLMWATRSAHTTDLDQPGDLVTGGVYAYSRNPMYVGWHLAYLGAGLLGRSAWPLASLPIVAVASHLEVRGEERRLTERFGDHYRAYAERVRRYV